MEPVDVLSDPRRVQDLERGQPGPHRIFAKLADGRDATGKNRVLAFANRYGFLGASRTSLFRDDGDPEYGMRSGADGQSWGFWEAAILEAAAAVAMWDCIQKGDAEALAPLVEWHGRPFAHVSCVYRQKRLISQWDFGREMDNPDEWRGGAGLIHHSVFLDECAGPHEPWTGDPVEAARQALYQHVMLRLDGQVSPHLLRGTDAELWYVPRTLEAAVYMHLGREISGRERLAIPCANPRCGRYFVPQRGSAKYCSLACRQQTYYHAKKQRA
jgi:hypothetical protein